MSLVGGPFWRWARAIAAARRRIVENVGHGNYVGQAATPTSPCSRQNARRLSPRRRRSRPGLGGDQLTWPWTSAGSVWARLRSPRLGSSARPSWARRYPPSPCRRKRWSLVGKYAWAWATLPLPLPFVA